MRLSRHSMVLLLLLRTLAAHGVEHVTVKDGIGIQAFYDNGSPLAYVDVTVFSPAQAETEFQSGVADKNGVFMFKPDMDGTWTIVFDDGLGHGLREEIDIQAGQTVEQTPSGVIPRWQKVLVGVSLIFGITGFLYGVTIKRQTTT